MNLYSVLINDRFAHTFAFIDRITGEVSTYGCDVVATAFRSAYRRMDSVRRECNRLGVAYDLRIVNCVTGVEVIALKR